ncbi:hypothetical protein, partial [Paenibacillus sp. GP183]|uniref:hypothetical protein n=1 Tax=Paenibacillus sp. GP183 TaxID=1882751 RepID=UPI000899AF4E
ENEAKDSQDAEHLRSAAFYQKNLTDITMLVHLREGKVYGFREKICFMTRYWKLCLTNSDVKAVHAMHDIFTAMDIRGDYSFEDIVVYSRSAVSAWEKWKEFWRKGYNYHQKTLIEFFNITPEEQRHMTFLMNEEEATRRNKERDQKYQSRIRKSNGAVTHDQTKFMILEVIKENPEMKDYKVAEIVKEKLGKCSEMTVKKVRLAIRK